MKIVFTCLGFSTTSVFIKDKNNKIHHVGYLDFRFEDKYDFVGFGAGLPYYLEADEVITEYKKQLNEKGVSINKDIVLAG